LSEDNPDLFKAMKCEPPADVFRQTGGSASSLASSVPASTKKRKSTNIESSIKLYSNSQVLNHEFQQKCLQFQHDSLEAQKKSREMQQERAATAREQLLAYEDPEEFKQTWRESKRTRQESKQ
jgi:hypothetical protein